MNAQATLIRAIITFLLFVVLLPEFILTTPVNSITAGEALRDDFFSNTFHEALGSAVKSRILQSNLSFDDLNALFDGTVVSVPDTSVRQNLGGIWGSVLFQIRDMTCFNIKIGSINAQYRKQSQRRIIYNLSISGLKIDCNLRWRYEYGFVRDSGRAQIFTANNALSNVISVESYDFRYSPPNKVNPGACQASVDVRDMDFQGGLSAFVANAFEQPFRDEAGDAIKGALCEELENLSGDIEKIILGVSDCVKTFYGEIPSEDADPLSGQSDLVVPNGMQLLDLTDTENSIGKWFTNGVDSIFEHLGALTDDPSSTTQDLAINLFLRDNILDEKGEFVPLNEDMILYEGVDPLTETTMILTRLSVVGLDSISDFGSVSVIGPQTLQTSISWDYLKVFIELKIIMRPSTSQDSVIVASKNPEVVERITVGISVSNIKATVSLLLALDQDKLGSLPLGSILWKDQLLPCSLSTAHDLHLAAIDFVAGTYEEPKVDNFISDGVDKLISDTLEAFHQMYKASIITAMPKYVATTLKSRANSIILKYINNASNTRCPQPSNAIKGLVDFRDLLLSPKEALQLGGSGKSPYGDIIPEAKKVVDEFIAEPDALNEAFIRPVTNDSSGSMLLPSDFLNVNILDDSVVVKSNYAQIDNADSFGVPTQFLEPISLLPYLLSNEVKVGVGPDPIRGTVGFSLARSYPNGNQFEDQIRISVDANKVDIFAPLIVRMDAAKFLNIPLEDVTNINCWLATMSSQNLDENGYPKTDDFVPNLSIEHLKFLYAEKIDLKVHCEKCVSPGIKELPTLIQLLSSGGVMNELLMRALKFVEELALTKNTQIRSERVLSHSNYLCPHNDLYDPLYNITEKRYPPLPQEPLPKDSIELLMLSAGIAAQVALVVVSVDLDATTSDEDELLVDPLSGEAFLEQLNVDPSTLVNLTEFQSTFDALMNYTVQQQEQQSADNTSEIESVAFVINNAVRSLLLDDNGIYALSPDWGTLSLGGYNFTVSSVKIRGLDSLRTADVLNLVSDHTLSNTFSLDLISFELTVLFVENRESNETATNKVFISTGANNVEITMATLIGVSKASLGAVRLGDLLRSSSVLPCLLSTVDHWNVTQMIVEIGDVDEPTISGSLSDDVRRTLSSSLSIVWERYAFRAISALETLMRSSAASALEDYVASALNASCPAIYVDDDGGDDDRNETLFVDFRDLFWNSSKAYDAGASGDEPYGDLSHRVKGFLDGYLLDADTLNDVLVGPQTFAQSNETGTLAFHGDLFNVSSDVIGAAVSGVRLQNLDSFSTPARLLDPEPRDGSWLSSEFGLGYGASRPLRGSIDLSVYQKGYDGARYQDDVNITVELSELDVVLSTIANIDADALLRFPVEDATNVNCWLATIPPATLDENGFPVAGQSPALSVAELALSTARSIDLAVDCVSCARPGMAELPSMIRALTSAGVIDGALNRSLAFVEELARSDTARTALDRAVRSASDRCSGADADELDHDPIPLHLESSESLEMVILATGVAAEVALAVTALDVAAVPTSNATGVADPLWGEASLEESNTNTSAFVDLTLWEAQAGSLLNEGLKGEGINDIVRTLLLNENGVYSVSLDVEPLSLAGFEFVPTSLNVGGLDTFRTADFFNTIARHTFRNTFSLDSLELELLVTERTTNDAVSVSVGLEGVAVDVSVLLAVVEERLGDVRLGSVLFTDHIFPCFMSTVDRLEVTDVRVGVARARDPVISAGFLSEGARDVLAEAARVIFDEYNSEILSALRTVIQDNARDLVSELLREYYEDATCPFTMEFDESDDDRYMDFRDLFLDAAAASRAGGRGTRPYGDLVYRLAEVLEDNLLSPDANGRPKVNDALLRPYTLNQSSVGGVMAFPDASVALGESSSANRFEISNVRLYGVDTVGYPLYLLRPHNNASTVLENALTVGVGGGSGDTFRATASVVVKVQEGDVTVNNELLVSLELNATTFLPSVRAAVDAATFASFPLRHLTNPSCWLATIPAPGWNDLGAPSQSDDRVTLGLEALDLTSAGTTFDVTCVSCTSPDVEELSSLTAVFENPRLASRLLERFLQSRAVRDNVGRTLNEAAEECPFHAGFLTSEEDEDEDDDAETFRPGAFVDESYKAVMSLGGAVFSSLLVITAVLFYIKRTTRRKHRSWLSSLTKSELLVAHRRRSAKQREEDRLRLATRPLVLSADVPLLVRLVIPIVVLGNVALFLSGHLSLGATLHILGQVAGQDVSMPDFFNFSLAESTIDMWEAGAIPLAVVIAVFSGLWPYTKQTITLVLWCAPPTKISPGRRGSVLRWLDALGKWSMIDIYVLFLSLIAFRLTITSPDDLLREDFYRVELLVIPMWGLYANMIAQLVSQVSSHFILHYHDKVVEEGKRRIAAEEGYRKSLRNDDNEKEDDDETNDHTHDSSLEDSDPPERLCAHSFRLGWSSHHDDHNNTLQVGPVSNALVLVVGLAALVTLVAGCWQTSITLDYLGLLGVVMEVGNDFRQAVYGYSFFDVVRTLMDLAAFVGTPGQYVGLGVLTALFVSSSLLVPVALVVLSLRIWFVPLTNRARTHHLKITEILKAWQYLEVYVLALLLGSWQLGGVSEFLFNDQYCADLDDAFNSMVYYGLLDQSDAQCFYNKASISVGTYYLAAASFLLAWLLRFVDKAARQKLEDDEAWREDDAVLLSDDDDDAMVRKDQEQDDDDDDDDDKEDGDVRSELLRAMGSVSPRFSEDYRLFLRRRRRSTATETGKSSSPSKRKGLTDSPTSSWEKSIRSMSSSSTLSCVRVDEDGFPRDVADAETNSNNDAMFPVSPTPSITTLDNYRDVRFFGPNRDVVNK